MGLRLYTATMAVGLGWVDWRLVLYRVDLTSDDGSLGLEKIESWFLAISWTGNFLLGICTDALSITRAHRILNSMGICPQTQGSTFSL